MVLAVGVVDLVEGAVERAAGGRAEVEVLAAAVEALAEVEVVAAAEAEAGEAADEVMPRMRRPVIRSHCRRRLRMSSIT